MRRRAQVYAGQQYQRLKCSFAPLFSAASADSKDLALRRSETKRSATTQKKLSRQLAISESVFSDFNGLRRHFRAIPFP
jgi:hypothetical protein